MKYKAMLKLMLGWVFPMVAMTSVGWFLLEDGLPLLTGSHFPASNWPFACTFLGFLGAVMLVSVFVGPGFQFGVSRYTMTRAYATALLIQAAAIALMALGLQSVAELFAAQRQSVLVPFAGFIEPSITALVVSVAYLAMMALVGGSVGLLFGLLLAYVTRRPMIILLVVFSGLMPMLVILIAMLSWWGLTSLWPAVKAWPGYFNQHPWLIVGLWGVLASVLLLLMRAVYLRLDAPKQVGWHG